VELIPRPLTTLLAAIDLIESLAPDAMHGGSLGGGKLGRDQVKQLRMRLKGLPGHDGREAVRAGVPVFLLRKS